MSRRDEIWRLNQLSAEELTAAEPQRLVVLPDADALHKHLARSIVEAVRAKPDAVLIVPTGPAAPYRAFCELVNRKRISLKRVRFFFMGDYADAAGSVLPTYHPLSARGSTAWVWEQIESELRPAEENVVFPDQYNIEELPAQIKKAGGADVCFGGVGIDGHVGFNEPEPGVRDSTCRLVTLNDFTVALHSIRSEVGGDLENFPRHAFTLGLRECLSARRVRLYCCCDVSGLDWAKTVLRLAVLGQNGDDCPVTWIRGHPDWQIITDRNSTEPPRYLL